MTLLNRCIAAQVALLYLWVYAKQNARGWSVELHWRWLMVLIVTSKAVCRPLWLTMNSPNVLSKCLSSAVPIVPFCSLSKTLKPSIKSAGCDASLFLATSFRIGKNSLKLILLSKMKKGRSNCLLNFEPISNLHVFVRTYLHTHINSKTTKSYSQSHIRPY